MAAENTKTQANANEITPRFSMRRYWPIMITAFVVIFVLLFPWIAEFAPMRNWIVGSLLKERNLQASSSSASFGYFSPLSLEELEIQREDNSLHVSIEKVECEKSWLRLWLDLPQAGTVHLQRPQVEIVVQEKDKSAEDAQEPRRRKLPEFQAIVDNAAIRLRRAADTEPVVDLKDLNVNVSIVREEQGHAWIVEPTLLLDQYPLTPELCDNGLQLVAPMLGNALNVSGSVSLDLKKFRVPLHFKEQGRADEIEIEGVVQLHDVSAGLKNPVLQSISALLAKMMDAKVPSQIHVLENSQIEFVVQDGRVQHQGLVFVFSDLSPDLRVETSGSVGLDESLDLSVSFSIPPNLLRDGPIARQLSNGPFIIQVGGTVDAPQIEFPSGQNWLAELGGALLSPDDQQRGERLQGALFNALDEILSERQERMEQREPREPREPRENPGLLNRIRQRRSQDGQQSSP